MQSFPPAFLPLCLLPPFPPRANQSLDTGAYFPSPLFSRLHDFARLSFFPSCSSVSPPTFLLSHLHFPNYCFLFRRPRRRSHRVVMLHLIFPSYFVCSTPCIATFVYRFIGNANFLPVHPSNRTTQDTAPFSSLLSQLWVLSLTFPHGNG